jgi:hypothetical protein
VAAAITATKTSEPLAPITVTGSGFAANTPYWITIKDPMGHTNLTRLNSDGTGAFTFKYVPQTPGAFTVEARPDVEFKGTTTATASTTTRAK